MKITRSAHRRTVLAAALAASVLSLAGCGDDGNGSAAASPSPTASVSVPAGEHNQADIDFAQGMIPHHRQAVMMSDMAETRASADEVKALAVKIRKAQEPEIATMSAWLTAWGEKVPQGMGGMDHGDASSMPGMMNDQQLDDMRGASGAAFDSMFLTQMIRHHEGAVAMAETEKKEGAYAPAKDLADDIITAQKAEIAQMREMLGTTG
ncbi:MULTISPECIES: DUF305 domain-containing protein [Streptomyces]|uniref:DUF305 domain-containing protein n=1 Tax=Streptomyces TaxID=1883 RepID=UPI00073DE92F|nr:MULTISPECIES: DUF305 domain-containing protein [unclassified Streptomyces]OYP13123.1 DUF305 domain-containing protein [Streptomyces sp. FBKL.4005]BCM64730.1 hypothetical protein EASAB2608_00064 [Streptomyces sp. EAS-AB2608]CUW32656.1 hypothetical protein TUE45_pSRTUE45c_0024 [Streptomyces reticuli]